MARYIGLDLGTSFVRICTKEDGIILRCPSAAAIDSQTNELVAVGADARKMIGKTPPDILACRPIRDGLVSEFVATVTMLKALFRNKQLCTTFNRPSVLLATPYKLNQVHELAAENAILSSGVRAVAQIPAIFAAAVGAGLKVTSPRGCMILNMGGGISEIAVISSGGIVNARSLPLAGERFDAAIIHYLRKRRNLCIGPSSAEEVKLRIGIADSSINRGGMKVYGRNERSKLASRQEVYDIEVCQAITPTLDAIVDAALTVLESVPPEISWDVYRYGIMLAGGCSLMPGLADAISRRMDLRVTVARQPLDCVALGLQQILKHPDLWDAPLRYQLR